MKTLSKTLLASAMVAAGITGFNTAHAVEWSLSGEIAVEWTDSDANDDLDLDVTTTDLVVGVSEKFGEVEVEGYAAFAKDDVDPDTSGLVDDGAGITVSGGFGSVFVGNDGTGVFVGDATDVLYNNSEAFFLDPTTNVIDYSLPLGDDFSLNIFLDSTSGDEEDIDALGVYGSYSFSGFTFALGYTSIDDAGAYTSTEVDGVDYADQEDILDFAVTFESGPIAAGVGYQSTELAGDDFEVLSAFLTYTAGPVTITPYYEDRSFDPADDDVVALNISYSFSDNFYAFFETADFDSDGSDNSEVGLVLTF